MHVTHFRSSSCDQYNEKCKLLADIAESQCDAEERQKALKAAAKAEKDAKKKKADLRLSAMHQSHAGKCSTNTHTHTHTHNNQACDMSCVLHSDVHCILLLHAAGRG